MDKDMALYIASEQLNIQNNWELYRMMFSKGEILNSFIHVEKRYYVLFGKNNQFKIYDIIKDEFISNKQTDLKMNSNAQIEKLKAIATEIRSDKNKIYYVLFQTSTEGTARVQFLAEYKEWQDYYLGSDYYKNFYKDTIPYIIKTERVKVPLTDMDIWERAKDKTMWVRHNRLYDIRQITEVCKDGVYIGIDDKRRTSYEQLMQNYSFANGDPCYKFSETEIETISEK